MLNCEVIEKTQTMGNRLSAVRQYIDVNRERFYEELFTLLRIPSVSAQEEHKGDMVLCAERMA